MKSLMMTLMILAFVSLAHAQQYGWVRVAQIGNQFNSINCVEFKDSLRGWVGDGSTGFHYTTDGGVSWFDAPGATVNPSDISMIDTSRGWAAAGETHLGGVFGTTNGGRSWIEQIYRFDRHYEGTATIDLSKNITVGYSVSPPDTGKVVQTSNGGATWTERTIADSIRSIIQIQFIDSSNGWALCYASQGTGILSTIDGGITWSLTLTPPISVMSFVSRSLGFGVAGAYCQMTTDSGVTWTQLGRIELPGWDYLHVKGISFVDSLYGWAFGALFYQGAIRGAICRTTDAGVTWTVDHLGTGVDESINAGIMIDRYQGWAVGTEGQVLAYRVVTSVPEKLPGIPRQYALKQNYPNPFNPTTFIEYGVAVRADVSIKVYDAGGREVKELVNGLHEAGVYRLRFDGTGLASGVYYCTLRAGQYSQTKQMTLLK